MDNIKIFFSGTDQVYRVEKIFKKKYNIKTLNDKSEKNNKYINLLKDIYKISKANILYTTFWGIPCKKNSVYLKIAKLLNKKVVCHWIGSDVLEALKNPKETIKLQKYIDINLTGSELLKSELLELGIKSNVENIILDDISIINNSTKLQEHGVLVYLPTGKEEFYGGKFIQKLAIEFPKINFYIVANTNKNYLKELRNIKNIGKVSLKEMENIYNKISILIRIPEHDGLSLMLLEALARGKEVIYKYDHPYTKKATNYSELKRQFEKIIGTLPKYNIEAVNYIEQNYKSDNYIENLHNMFKELIGE
ncbi:hypothetical protein [uncultured Cetobacterium sp.]|uniref:hypothetical protein n=1 Tax=uncultured Cetobacterium sp. TaxID=527638 RepID=UPI0026160CEA|nr:hypothetical protein [uncultured Cetobacterium sp.]